MELYRFGCIGTFIFVRCSCYADSACWLVLYLSYDLGAIIRQLFNNIIVLAGKISIDDTVTISSKSVP